MAAEVRIRSFSSTDDDYTTAFLQTTNSDRCTQGASHGVSHGHMAYVNEDDMSTEEDDVFIRDPVKGKFGVFDWHLHGSIHVHLQSCKILFELISTDNIKLLNLLAHKAFEITNQFVNPYDR